MQLMAGSDMEEEEDAVKLQEQSPGGSVFFLCV